MLNKRTIIAFDLSSLKCDCTVEDIALVYDGRTVEGEWKCKHGHVLETQKIKIRDARDSIQPIL